MFHVNPADGVTGPCRAEKGGCPFGSPEQHFPTREAAETYYSETMGGAFAEPKQASTDPAWDTLVSKSEEWLTPTDWNNTVVGYAMSKTGSLALQAKLAAAEPGSREHAVLSHIIAEANRAHYEALGAKELVKLIQDARSGELAKTVATVKKPQVDLIHFEGERVLQFNSFNQGWTVQSYDGRTIPIQDLYSCQQRLNTFLAAPEKARKETLQGLYPAYRMFSKLAYAKPPRLSQMDLRTWQAQALALKDQTWDAAQKALAHPEATSKDFDAVREVFGTEAVLTLDACPRSVREDFLADRAERYGADLSGEPELLEKLRNERIESNRVALYLAAMDEDDFHRLEAMNQLVSAPMISLKAKDRAWLARNMDQLPGNEGTHNILKDALRDFALNESDKAEQDFLLPLVTKKEPKRGWLR